MKRSSDGTDRSFTLQIIFSQQERDFLKEIAKKDCREEGPQVKWLIKEYAAGRLKVIP